MGPCSVFLCNGYIRSPDYGSMVRAHSVEKHDATQRFLWSSFLGVSCSL